MFTRLIAGAICLVALTSAAPEPGDLPAVRTPAELRDILADLGPDAIAALGAADPADALNKLGVKQLADNPDKAMSFRYFEAACALSSDKGCNNYANVFNAKDFSRHDAAKALRIYEHLCAKNLAAACINAAVNLRDARKADEAFPFISKSCALDYADGCRRKGVFITYATGTPFSLKGARSAFARACALGDKQGCDNDAFLNTRASELALLEGTDGYSMRGYWANEPNNFVGDGLSALDKKNFARAEAIFAMSCQRDGALGCLELGKLKAARAAQLTKPKDHSAAYADYNAAFDALKKSCGLRQMLHSETACNAFSVLVTSRPFGRDDETLTVWEAACDAGYPDPCWRYGRTADSSSTRDETLKAIALYDKGCALRDNRSCAGADVQRSYLERKAASDARWAAYRADQAAEEQRVQTAQLQPACQRAVDQVNKAMDAAANVQADWNRKSKNMLANNMLPDVIAYEYSHYYTARMRPHCGPIGEGRRALIANSCEAGAQVRQIDIVIERLKGELVCYSTDF